MPSLFTAGISDDEAHTRATSSITMQVASASAPTPSYSSGTCGRVEVRGPQRVVGDLRERGGLVDLRGVRGDLGLRHGTDGVPQSLVVLGDAEQVEVVAGHGGLVAALVQCVGVEAAAGLAAEQAGVDHPGQQRRRRRRAAP